MQQIGMISDTHMPERWQQLPATIFEIFAGVDLIIHAGDVGELWVLDELSKLAPVVAVHGNDETHAATAALPYLQTLVTEGYRLVVTHSHYQDVAAEAAARREDRWLPKMDYYAHTAMQHGATLYIYGHTHIPMAHCYQGIWLINPGAIASSGIQMRQKIQSVARLTLTDGHPPQINHFDLKDGQPHVPATHWDAGFKASAALYYEPIFEPELLAQLDWLRENLRPVLPAVVQRILPLAQACWSGEKSSITIQEFVHALIEHPSIKDKLRRSSVFSQYL